MQLPDQKWPTTRVILFLIGNLERVEFMLTRKIFILIILLVSIPLSGCGKTANKAAVTGVIAHAHPMSLPAGYVLSILLADTTSTQAPGKKIAEVVIKSQGDELPMPFAIIYDPGKINPDHTYSIWVEIVDAAGILQYKNLTGVPVITHGNPTSRVKLTVVLSNE